MTSEPEDAETFRELWTCYRDGRMSDDAWAKHMQERVGLRAWVRRERDKEMQRDKHQRGRANRAWRQQGRV